MSSRRVTRPAAAVAAVAVTLLVAGCGGGGTVTVAGPSGAIASIGPSGIAISGSEGSLVVGGAQLPDGWPSEVPSPEGFTVQASARSGSGDTATYTVTWKADGDQTTAITSYVDSLKAAGFTVTSQVAASDMGGSGGVYELASASWQVGLVASVSDGTTNLLMSVEPASA